MSPRILYPLFLAVVSPTTSFPRLFRVAFTAVLLLSTTAAVARQDTPQPTSTTTTTVPTESIDSSVESPADEPRGTGQNIYSATGSSRYLVDTGPLRIRDQFGLGLGFLAFDPVSADNLPPGRWQVDVIGTVANDFVHSNVVETALEERTTRAPLTLDQLRGIQAEGDNSGIYILDAEHYRTGIAIRRGLTPRVQVEAVVSIISIQGGILDGLIEGFHDTFSFGQAGRTGVPRDAFLTYVRTPDREIFVNQDPGVELSDTVLGVKVNLLKPNEGRQFHLAIEGLVKVPTGSEDALLSSGSVDVGAQLLATRYFQKACLHASLGVLNLGSFDVLGLDQQIVLSGMIAYERAMGGKMSGLAQLTVSQSPFDDLRLEELAETSIQITLGIKRVIFDDQVLFLGLTENVANFNNSADIGFHVGLTRTFG